MSIAYFECVILALVIHTRYACAILLSAVCPAIHYVINGTIFEKELLNIKCGFWLPLCEKFLILKKKIEIDMI